MNAIHAMCRRLRLSARRRFFREDASGDAWRWVVLCILMPAIARAAPRELWVYCPTNLLVDENVDQLDKLWKRAGAAGYSHVLLADSKFARLDALGTNADHYNKNITKTKAIAAKYKLTIVPAVFPIGYSNDILSHDPNLAEGLPVQDTPFVVKNGVATVDMNPIETLDKIGFKDDAVTIDDGVATINNVEGNGRFVFAVRAPNYRCYHVSVKVKTAEFHGDARVVAIADKAVLNFGNLGYKPTQDWAECHVVFDTLDHTQIGLYFGVWGGCRGKLQWKDWKIEEVGLVNVLRRAGTPVVVKGYTEGKDFEPIVDPKLGNTPYAGEYTAWHEPPVIKTKGIKDGTVLKVSWYYPPIVENGQVMICPSEPATVKLLETQAKLMKGAWAAPGYMMSHDEIRCLNWDESCQKRDLDPGKILADNATTCTKLLGGSTAYAWSDMFDPYHNAHDGYYLVCGDLKKSWDGLSKDVVVMNWNYDNRDKSLKFFDKRGNKQIIAGYYDGDVNQIKDWLASASKVSTVVGVMYTTWANHYDDLEPFAKLVKAGENK